MMKYYAKLNENEICTEIVSTKKDLKGIRGFIEIPDYNETVLYRKWKGNQWSSDRYEPALETQIQDKLKALTEKNEKLIKQIEEKNKKIDELESQQKITLMGLMDVNSKLRELQQKDVE